MDSFVGVGVSTSSVFETPSPSLANCVRPRSTQKLKTPTLPPHSTPATPTVRRDILTQLEVAHATQIVSGFDRPNLYLEVREVATNHEKIRAIMELTRWAPLGIVYAGTRKNVEEIYANLRRGGIEAAAY